MKINKNIISLGVGLIVLAIFILGVVLVAPKLVTPSTPKEEQKQIVIEDSSNGRKITFNRDGYVTYADANGSTSEAWESGKIASLFEYVTTFLQNGEGGYSVYINGELVGSLGEDDELVEVIINEVGSGGGGGGSGGGGIGGYFPTPAPTPYNLPIQGSNPTPGPTLPPAAPSWCSNWKLSYCADPLQPNVTPSPTSQTVALPPDCNEPGNQNTGRTVITNVLCVGATPEP